MLSQRNSHTHCQAPLAYAKTQAWQRVCLSNRTTKTTDKPADEEEHRTDNSTYPKGGVSCSANTFVQAESSVLRMEFCGKNPALLVAAKRQDVKKLTFKLYS